MATSATINLERKLCVMLLDGSQNMVMSPYSAGACMAMVLAGAAKKTLDEMYTGMGIDAEGEDAFMRQHKKRSEYLNSEHHGLQLVVCNSLWADGSVEAGYKTACKDYFNAEVLHLCTKETINAWIAEKTHNKIPELLKDKVSGPSVVVNAVWFKGTFKTFFDKDATKDRRFYPEYNDGCPGDSVMVPTMNKVEKMLYADHNAGSIVELPYGDSTFGLVIILPSEASGVALAVQKIIGEDWTSVRDSMTRELIDLQLPKCSLKYDFSLKSTMQDMGMNDVFSPSQACLDKLMKTMPGAYIVDVIQAATMDVDEVGVEAAAVTAAIAGTRGSRVGRSPTPIDVIVNRPYIMMVVDKELDVILFAAVVKNPKVE
jgi:serpin B